MEDKLKQLIRLFSEMEGCISVEKIARKLNISKRSVYRQIKLVEDNEKSLGFTIKNLKGKGYFIEDSNRLKLEMFLSQNHILLSEITIAILGKNDILVDDLAEMFSYSRSNMTRYIAQITQTLTPFHLELESKAYKGLYVKGPELNIRATMISLLNQNLDLCRVAYLLEIKEFNLLEALSGLENNLLAVGIYPNPVEIQSFINFLLVSVARRRHHTMTSFPQSEIIHSDVLLSNKKFKLCLEKLCLWKWFEMPESKGEVIYLALAFEQLFSEMSVLKARMEPAHNFFENMMHLALKKMDTHYHLNLCNDFVLLNALVQHIKLSYGTYLLGLDISNPYAEMIQKKYPIAFHCVREIAEIIWTNTNIPVQKGELAYLSLHLAASLERQDFNNKIPAAIICSTGFGTAALLKQKLEQHFSDSIIILEVLSLNEAEKKTMPVKLYISTLPIENKSLYGKPVIYLSPFLEHEQILIMEKTLAQLRNNFLIDNYFREDCFFRIDKCTKKDTVLHAICDKLSLKGYLIDENKRSVFEREAVVSTEIFPLVALPHCFVQRDSFISITILDNPVFWGKAKVRLILMCCFKQQDENIKQLLTQLYKILSNEKNVQSILECPDYHSLVLLLDLLIRGDVDE